MEQHTSPLQKYRRQPKVYINLPSKGKFYKENVLYENTFTELPTYSMTANDEVLYKTPDALINGEATVSNIKSCIPSILDPWQLVTIDIDTILLAIRLSSYGEYLTLNNVCSKCNESNSYDVSIQKIIDYYYTLEYDNKIYLEKDLVVNIAPLTYKLWSTIQKTLIGYQRTLQITIPKIKDEEEKNRQTDIILKEIANLNLQIIFEHIKNIEVEGEVVQDPKEILDFLNNSDVVYFKKIKSHIDRMSDVWKPPVEKVTCGHCEAENSLQVRVDQSDFFGKG